MSLVVTSNQTSINGNDGLNTGINLPYNYHNYLSQPLKLEANSEVAVQSVKVVKTGNTAIHIANNCFYLYQGKDNTDSTTGGDFDVDKTTSIPVICQIGSNTRTEVNSEQLAKLVKDALTRGICNPNLVASDVNTSGILVSTERESATADFGAFLGFDINFHQSISGSNTDTKSNMGFVNLIELDDTYNGSWNTSTHKITKTGADKCEMLATLPLSNCSGVFKTSFKGAGGNWDIGLTRWKNYQTDNPDDQRPSYYDDHEDPDYEFIDWVAKSVFDGTKLRLRLYHAVLKGNTSSLLTLEEFEYWNVGPASASLSEPIEIFDTSASYGTTNISEISFIVKNERMGVFVQSSDGTSASYTLANGTEANKNHNLKPNGIVTRYMYPQVKVTEDLCFVEVQTYNGVTPTGWDYNAQLVNFDVGLPNNVDEEFFLDMTTPIYDYWARIINTDGEEKFGEDIESRYMFDIDSTTAYTQLGLNGSDALDTEIDIILAEDEDYLPSEGANAGDLLGFPNTPVLKKALRNTDNNLLQQYISNAVPQLSAKGSIFVRLNNFTQESYNAQTSQPSKILYHLPRFDNGGADVGALFYEPSEKTYVKLNNSHDININDFEISLVNPDETLANNLTGKTIVVLHFRKSL
jgi:hypothetical protein